MFVPAAGKETGLSHSCSDQSLTGSPMREGVISSQALRLSVHLAPLAAVAEGQVSEDGCRYRTLETQERRNQGRGAQKL